MKDAKGLVRNAVEHGSAAHPVAAWPECNGGHARIIIFAFLVLLKLIADFFCKAEHVFDVEYFAIIENSLAADAPEYLMLIGGNH